MSSFEIFIIVLVCVVPIIALFMVLPKIKIKFKSKQKKSPKTKTYAEIKAEEEPKEVKIEEKPKETKKQTIASEISTEDFKNYLNRRQPTTKPSKMELSEDFVDRTSPYFPRRMRRSVQKPKNVAEEIKNLSPELKAMLIAGVLDKKDYDEDI